MLQTSESDYNSVLSEFLQKQVLIFGHDAVVANLQDIKGLVIDSEGIVKKLEGSPQQVLEEVVKKLSELSDYAVKHSLDTVVAAHADKSPIPADVSHLPSMEEQVLQSIPLSPTDKES